MCFFCECSPPSPPSNTGFNMLHPKQMCWNVNTQRSSHETPGQTNTGLHLCRSPRRRHRSSMFLFPTACFPFHLLFIHHKANTLTQFVKALCAKSQIITRSCLDPNTGRSVLTQNTIWKSPEKYERSDQKTRSCHPIYRLVKV